MTKRRDHSQRSSRYTDRRQDTREVRQRFLIVCEGTKTEPAYFRSFRVPKQIIVHIRGLGFDPVSLVEEAIHFAQNDRYDQVWCVFDRDDVSSERFNRAIQLAQQNHIRVAYSNQAFELWYVLHFEFLNSAISRFDYIKKLQSLLGSYQKNSSLMYNQLLSRQQTAIANAQKLLAQYDPRNPEKDNPSTTVHLLVLELNRFLL